VTLRPAAVAFDVNETLFSLEALNDVFAEGGLGSEAVRLWFARILRDGFALSVTGDYRSFADLGATHLDRLLPAPDPDLVLAVLARFRSLEPHPDAEPALARLRDAGLRVVTLTNGSAETVTAMLKHAGLDHHVEASLSVEDVGCWKPRPEPYHHAADRLGLPPEAVAMVAVHSWDVHGASRAGLVTGFCTRLEGGLVDGFAAPDVTGDTLVEVADGLLALPRELRY
jgi:2-haloacid dehalogenase